MDGLGLSQRCGNGGKGIGSKRVYGEYLHLKKRLGGGVFDAKPQENFFFFVFLVWLLHYYLVFFFFFSVVLAAEAGSTLQVQVTNNKQRYISGSSLSGPW